MCKTLTATCQYLWLFAWASLNENDDHDDEGEDSQTIDGEAGFEDEIKTEGKDDETEDECDGGVADSGEEGDEEEGDEEDGDNDGDDRERDYIRSWRNGANDAAAWTRRLYSWEYFADGWAEEQYYGTISRAYWGCGMFDDFGLPRPVSQLRSDTRFQRDVFYLARCFLKTDWPWRVWDNSTKSWRDLDTAAMASDYERPFESLESTVPRSVKGDATPYRFAEIDWEHWLCPPALTALFGEIFADESQRRPDAAEAATRLRKIVER